MRGVFWLIDGELLAVPYDDSSSVGISKSGNNYNHKLLWEHVEPRKCNKPFNYYPRGRVELNNKGEPGVYMNPNISEEFIPTIMDIFEIKVVPKIVRFSIVSKKGFQECSRKLFFESS